MTSPQAGEDKMTNSGEGEMKLTGYWAPVNLSEKLDVGFVEWDDCSMGFNCSCGQPDLIVDAQGDDVICPKCGKKFYLSVQLLVWRGEP